MGRLFRSEPAAISRLSDFPPIVLDRILVYLGYISTYRRFTNACKRFRTLRTPSTSFTVLNNQLDADFPRMIRYASLATQHDLAFLDAYHRADIALRCMSYLVALGRAEELVLRYTVQPGWDPVFAYVRAQNGHDDSSAENKVRPSSCVQYAVHWSVDERFYELLISEGLTTPDECLEECLYADPDTVVRLVPFFVARGAHPTRTAVARAAFRKHERALEVLFRAGGVPTLRLLCTLSHDLRILRILVNRYITSVGPLTPDTLQSILERASQFGTADVIRFVVDLGASPNVGTTHGKPLALAVDSVRRVENVRALLDLGAVVSVREVELVVRRKRGELLRIMLEEAKMVPVSLPPEILQLAEENGMMEFIPAYLGGLA
ncbi:hypothetical protein BJ742DRAFT_782097 [Cladochytrium replicatum]|nr:hypothetical protein BJ742DRAFT_782097 [Cladochytrium replicatum]